MGLRIKQRINPGLVRQAPFFNVHTRAERKMPPYMQPARGTRSPYLFTNKSQKMIRIDLYCNMIGIPDGF